MRRQFLEVDFVSSSFFFELSDIFTAENIYLAGSVNALQDWDADSALLLSSANYPIWSSAYHVSLSFPLRLTGASDRVLVTVNLPANTIVQYKFIRKDGGSVTWESDPNNQFTTNGSGAQTLNDSWR